MTHLHGEEIYWISSLRLPTKILPNFLASRAVSYNRDFGGETQPGDPLDLLATPPYQNPTELTREQRSPSTDTAANPKVGAMGERAAGIEQEKQGPTPKV